MENVKKAGDILLPLLNSCFDSAAMENGQKTAELFTSWAIAAGEVKIPAAADHCRIRELERGILVIEAEHPGWVQILQTKQNLLLKLFQGKFPELEIHGLSFCLSRDPIYKPAAESVKKPVLPELGISGKPAETGVSADPADITAETEDNKALYESIRKFRKVIQNRNRNSSGTDNP